jgi:hypothetical protein
VTVDLQGLTHTYRLDLGANAMCAAEEATGLPWRQLLRRFRAKRPDPAVVRGFLTATLVDVPLADARAYRRVLRDLGGVALLRDAVKGLV